MFVFVILFVKFLLEDLDPLVLESSMGFGQILCLPAEIGLQYRGIFRRT
jgi:hypothetical protein